MPCSTRPRGGCGARGKKAHHGRPGSVRRSRDRQRGTAPAIHRGAGRKSTINSKSVGLLQHPADRSEWLSDAVWPATLFDHPGIHPLLVSPSLGRAGTDLRLRGRDPRTDHRASAGTRRLSSGRDSAHPQRTVPALRRSGRAKERCPCGRGSVAGHKESDSHVDRSVGCWSSSKLVPLRPAHRPRSSAMNQKKSPPDLPGGSTARPFSRRHRPAQRGPALLATYASSALGR
jgi:hypothetical protein